MSTATSSSARGAGPQVDIFPCSCYTEFVSPKGQRRSQTERVVKTTVDLPEDLWKAAKVRAMDERSDLRSVIIAALEAYLKTKVKRKDGSP